MRPHEIFRAEPSLLPELPLSARDHDSHLKRNKGHEYPRAKRGKVALGDKASSPLAPLIKQHMLFHILMGY